MTALSKLDREWWLVLVLACLGMAVSVTANTTDRFDYFLYDFLQRQTGHAPDPKILLVSVDNRSIEALGAWPWSRETDARLIAQLGKAHPRGIAMDVLLLDKTEGQGDQRLADAIASSGPFFLPVEFDIPGPNGAAYSVVEPLASFKNAASGLGNVNLSPDRDGQIRRAFLDYGDERTTWPSLAWLLASRDLPRNSTIVDPRVVDRSGPKGILYGRQPVLINYAGPAGSFPCVSAVSVLRGEVPNELLHNRLILVGATASGLGDLHATPTGVDGSMMPGIEIQANLLDTLLHNRQIIPAQGLALYLFALAPLVILLVALRFVRLHLTLGIIVVLLAGIAAVSLVLLREKAFWLPPGSALLGIALVYPLWTWRKLAVAVRYISVELQRSANESGPLERVAPEFGRADFIEQQIVLLRLANNRERDLRRFLIDRLTQMPDCLMVTNLAGDVVLANAGATALFGDLHGPASLQRANDLLGYLTRHSGTTRNKLDFSSISRLSATPWTCQAETSNGKTYHVRFEPQRSSDEELIGYVIRLADNSEQIALQRQREDILQLLTHDMRAPQASIIALLDSLDEGEVEAKTANRIRNYATRTLKLADDFVHLARAQRLKFTFRQVDLSDIVRDATDALWPQTRLRQIKLTLSLPDGPLFVGGEGSLLLRMMINLIDNAVKYSVVAGPVQVSLVKVEQPGGWFARLSVKNTGIGMDPDQLSVLYERFHRGGVSGSAAGVGLGLAFVHTVVVRHNGAIHCESEVDGETCFTVMLPLARSEAPV